MPVNCGFRCVSQKIILIFFTFFFLFTAKAQQKEKILPQLNDLMLTCDGKENFQATSALSSGLDVDGEVRRIIFLQEKKQIILLKIMLLVK